MVMNLIMKRHLSDENTGLALALIVLFVLLGRLVSAASGHVEDSAAVVAAGKVALVASALGMFLRRCGGASRQLRLMKGFACLVAGAMFHGRILFSNKLLV